jgi:hypothetical protein
MQPTGKHPLAFDERGTIDSSKYAQPLYITITNIVMVMIFVLIWPILRLLDRRMYGKVDKPKR